MWSLGNRGFTLWCRESEGSRSIARGSGSAQHPWLSFGLCVLSSLSSEKFLSTCSFLPIISSIKNPLVVFLHLPLGVSTSQGVKYTCSFVTKVGWEGGRDHEENCYSLKTLPMPGYLSCSVPPNPPSMYVPGTACKSRSFWLLK